MAKGKFDYWLTDDGLLLLSAWARDGLTDKQIAHNMGIAYSTFRVWKDKYPAMSAALKKNKEIADIEVENAMHKKAVGFKETVKKPVKVKRVEYVDGKRNREYEEVVEAEEEIYIPPDTTAGIFWLKNRKPATWRDKPDGEGQGTAVTIINDIPRVLENVNTLDDIVRHPAENRDIEDFE